MAVMIASNDPNVLMDDVKNKARPTAGPEIAIREPEIQVTTRPAIIAEISPEAGGSCVKLATPRHNGIATRKTIVAEAISAVRLARRSLEWFIKS